jgi:hypothetical protein
MMHRFVAALLLVVGCAVGLKLPDFDHSFRWLPLVDHRSLLTHGLLVPLLLLYAVRRQIGKEEGTPLRLMLIGLCLGVAVHLAFDLFARSWSGYSLVHVPFYGRLPGTLSRLVLLSGVLGGLYLACRLLRSTGDLALSLLSLAVLYGVSAAAQPRPSFYALVTLVPAALVAFVLPPRTTGATPGSLPGEST